MKKIIILICLIILVTVNISYAEEVDTHEVIESQKENFGISDFLTESEKYSGDFFEDIDIKETLDNAISGNVDNNNILKKVINLVTSNIKTTIKSLVSILVIVVIHSILKNISDNLQNSNVSQVIYYVQYILIVTIIMSNFSDIINLVKDTFQNLVGFINLLVPILINLMIYTGSITTGGLLEPIILFTINFIANAINNILIPIVLIATALSIISKISDKIQIDKLSEFFKSGVVWFLGIVLTLFVGIISLEGTLSSSVDGITAKTTKAVVTNAIPVVGKILGDAVDTVLGCGVILKNAIGIVGVIIVIGICISPIIKLATLTIIYNLASAIIQPIADNKIVKLLGEMGGIFKLLLAILCSISVMLIIGVTLVVKISNSGMMYR